MEVHFLILFFGFWSVHGSDSVITLGSSSDKAVDGQHFTLKCSLNSSVLVSAVTWTLGDTKVLTTSHGFGIPLGDMKTAYGDIFGRYFVTAYGPHEHHVTLLVNRNKDGGRKWMCESGGLESNRFTIQTVEASREFQCGMTCVYGAAVGATFLFLFILLLASAAKCKGR